MIVIRYDRGRNLVTMRGHAGSAECGRDLVCAAASALCYTLAANVQALEQAGAARGALIQLAPGRAVIGCTAARGKESQVRMVFGTVCLGIAVLAQGYPEFVVFEA